MGDGQVEVYIWEGGEYECPHWIISQDPPESYMYPVKVFIPEEKLKKWEEVQKSFWDFEEEIRVLFDAQPHSSYVISSGSAGVTFSDPDRPTRQVYRDGKWWPA